MPEAKIKSLGKLNKATIKQLTEANMIIIENEGRRAAKTVGDENAVP